MDDRLVPAMAVLMAALVLGVAYAVYSFWRTRRRVAWNVVNAALTLRRLGPEQSAAVGRATQEMLPSLRMTPDALAAARPEVRFAVVAMAMHRLGIAPVESAQPFRPLASPHLARSAARQVQAIRMLAEAKHGLRLAELEVDP